MSVGDKDLPPPMSNIMFCSKQSKDLHHVTLFYLPLLERDTDMYLQAVATILGFIEKELKTVQKVNISCINPNNNSLTGNPQAEV